jgi:hypothetical protein
MGQETKTKLDALRSKYGLREIKDNKYEDVLEVVYLKQLTAKTLSQFDLVNNTIGRNIFAQQIRQYKSILSPRLDKSDRRYFQIWADEYDNAIQANEQLRLLFNAQDTLNEILVQDGSRSYEAFENDEGGILSDYIKSELADGRGFSLLIKAPPRSSKSWTANRLASNVSGDKFEVGTPDKLGDVLYTDMMFHTRRKQRRENNTLAFSTVIIDEGIEVIDSMRGIWDESIQSMIKIMKTGFFENWLLIVVTPDESDIAKRVRDSFSAVMEPYYDSQSLQVGDIKRNKNWNEKTGWSSWKFHANDQRIKIHGLGKITKVNVMKPPQKIIDLYEPLSQYYKLKIQGREASNAEKRELKTNRADLIDSKVKELLQDREKLAKTFGSMGFPTADGVNEVVKLGIGASRHISTRLRKVLKAEKEEMKKDGVDQPRQD